MLDTIRSRLIAIAILVALSVWALWPRQVTTRVRGENGRMRDSTSREVNLKKGLDLQGGIHLALELDESRGQVPNRADAIDRALKVIRIRIDQFGVAEPLVQKEGAGRIVVELPGISDPGRAKEIVQRSAFLEFQMTDKENLFRQALPGMDRALAAAGVSEASVGRQMADSAARAPEVPSSAVEDILSGARPPAADTGKAAARHDTARARRDTARDTAALLGGPLSPLLFAGSMAGQYLVAEEKVPIVQAMVERAEVQRLLPRGIVLRWGGEPLSRGARAFRPVYALQERPIITGEYLIDAKARIDPLMNQAIVVFQLSRRGGRIFERETGKRVGDYMAIVLDGQVQSQPPVLRSQIGANGQIELGNASLRDAEDLALVLRAGALPAPLLIVEERSVGPSLGRDSIDKSVVAAAVGIGLVILIMVGYYRFAGILAVLALGLYVLFTLGGLAALGATLTLPGMAGFMLSVGMAVDANVLIFERIREELALGKSVRLAVDAGFKMAMSAIVDSNVTTILTAAFLFQFGTGPVRGFATTLILGIMASMVTAIFVTRTYFLIYLERRPGLQTLSI
ncbi:MAG: protein-export membrane protein SecD [Gemmatimonadetes bacterium RIFCSPLOWO2_02_FULL_71_11]|nr:MAG: protein-export membrane protein SecD [Gemmatimonadetes bacterium RIFCSPLOWO2_02_FULL_71_11]